MRIEINGRPVAVRVHARLSASGLLVMCGRAGCHVELVEIREQRGRKVTRRELLFAESWRPDTNGVIRRSSRADRGLLTPRRARRWAADSEGMTRTPRQGETRLRPGGWYRGPEELPLVIACYACLTLNVLSATALRVGGFPTAER